MINKYKKVSVIYGRGGRECAVAIHRNLQRLHDEDGMPVEPHLLAEELLSSADIVSRVRDIISASALCIILLTFDDVDNSRVRQNVLIEIGMALVLIGRERCFVVSEKQFLPDDFPSDIRGALNPNYMQIREAEQSAEKITQAIVKKMGLKSHNQVLEDQKYAYDYMKVLEDIPGYIFEEKPDLQMLHILDVWRSSVNSFTFTEERICFILERVVFLPIFPVDHDGKHVMQHFLEQLKEAVRTEVRDFSEEETEDLIAGRSLVMRVLEYVELRQLHTWDMRGAMLRYEFERIADELEDMICRCQEGELSWNWYMQVVALDYAALARMQAQIADPDEGDRDREYLRTAIGQLTQVQELIRQYCKRAGELWNGYVDYNLSRAYERLYKLDMMKQPESDPADVSAALRQIQAASFHAISTRRRWIGNGMKGIFSTALSYEYFLALMHEYELCENLPGYSEMTPEKIKEEIRKTLAELSVYCETTGLEKLFAIRERFEKMARRLS